MDKRPCSFRVFNIFLLIRLCAFHCNVPMSLGDLWHNIGDSVIALTIKSTPVVVKLVSVYSLPLVSFRFEFSVDIECQC